MLLSHIVDVYVASDSKRTSKKDMPKFEYKHKMLIKTIKSIYHAHKNNKVHL